MGPSSPNRVLSVPTSNYFYIKYFDITSHDIRIEPESSHPVNCLTCPFFPDGSRFVRPSYGKLKATPRRQSARPLRANRPRPSRRIALQKRQRLHLRGLRCLSNSTHVRTRPASHALGFARSPLCTNPHGQKFNWLRSTVNRRSSFRPHNQPLPRHTP